MQYGAGDDDQTRSAPQPAKAKRLLKRGHDFVIHAPVRCRKLLLFVEKFRPLWLHAAKRQQHREKLAPAYFDGECACHHVPVMHGQGDPINMDPRVTELHCIMPIANVASVMQHGILSHEMAAKLPHYSVAMQVIQDRRDVKAVHGGLKLHQYANLYFHARNPMLYKRRNERVCVLRISTEILGLAGVVITDQNAASGYVRFLGLHQWQSLNFENIYARDWTHPDDKIMEWRHKSQKCAEVLVPRRVHPDMIFGAYVVDEAAQKDLNQTGFDLPITVDPDFFFR